MGRDRKLYLNVNIYWSVHETPEEIISEVFYQTEVHRRSAGLIVSI